MRRTKRIIAVMLTLALMLTLAPGVVFADGTTDNTASAKKPLRLDGYYKFVTPKGNVLALQKRSIDQGTAIVLKKNNRKAVGRQFFLIPSKTGYHQIKNSISFKALSLKRGVKSKSVPLVQKTYKKGNKAMRFKFVPAGGGWYYLKTLLGPYVSAKSDKAGAAVVSTPDKSKALKVKPVSVKYSTGVAKIDKEIWRIRDEVGTKGAIMRRSYFYVIGHYGYEDHEDNYTGDWIGSYSWYMLSKGKGHCGNYASLVCQLFRSCGYEAHVVSGTIMSRSRGWVVHAWVEVKVNGKVSICDPSQNSHYPTLKWYLVDYDTAPIVYRIGQRW
jgi:hypothetical protein